MANLLYTPVDAGQCPFAIGTSSRVVMLGSCFAEHVGELLSHELAEGKAEVNPFGVLYNPLSISQALRLLMAADGEQMVTQRIFLGKDGLWHSWFHTTHFSGRTREDCADRIIDRYRKARESLKRADVLCLTFGTTRCYRLADGLTVANCHKEPQRTFAEYEPGQDELYEDYCQVAQLLHKFNPVMKVCVTISPYRYRKYGFHESQLQKAKLLLLTEKLSELGWAYFPSYEIMMDELRDYRFYADDMLHPSGLAVSIIYDRFKEWCFTDDMKIMALENLKKWKRSQHRAIAGMY